MLTLSPIERVATFANANEPFLQTEGAMQFALVNADQLDLNSYQRSLARLALALARRGRPLSPLSSSPTPITSPPSLDSNVIAIAKRRCVFFVSAAASALGSSSTVTLTSSSATTEDINNYVLTFVSNGMLSSLPAFTTKASLVSSSTAMDVDERTQQQQPKAKMLAAAPQSAPLSPLSPTSPDTSHTPRYILRLPLDPTKAPIESRLSAKRLGAADVHLLDGILRRLCDATPGAFRLVYSDGLSGMEHGNAIMYEGNKQKQVENFIQNLDVQRQQQQQQQFLQQQYQKQETEQHQREKSLEEELDVEDFDDGFEAMLAGHVDHFVAPVGFDVEDMHSMLWAPGTDV